MLLRDMIRSELVLRVAELNPHLYEKDCEAVVDAILDTIANALAAGDRVEIRGFGAFTTKDLRARQGRNPRTGERVAVAEKAVAFKPGKAIREMLIQRGEDLERSAARLLRAS